MSTGGRRALAVLVLGLAACNPGTPLSVDGVVVLRWGHLVAEPLGLGGGRLTFEGGCAGLETGRDPVVVLWPPTTQFDRSTGDLRLVIDGVPFREGDVLQVGGGEVKDQGWARSLVGPIPAACQRDAYLLATEVVVE